MNSVKKIVTVVLSLCSVVCLSLASLAFVGTPTAAKAENVSVEQGFYVEKGAAVRLKDGESGIRFSTVVTEEYYNGLLAEYGNNAVVEFYTVIGAGENLKNPVEYKAADPIFENGVFNYREVIYYDNLKNDLTAMYEEAGKTGEELTSLVEAAVKKAYATELNVKAVAKITVGENTTTVEAHKTDNLRSMSGVALDLLVSGDYKPEQKSALEAYLGGAITITDVYGADAYYDNSVLSGDVTTENLPTGDYTVYYGAKKVSTISVTDGTETLNLTGIEGLTDGKDYSLTFYNADTNKAYKRTFKAVTKILTKPADLEVFKTTAEDSEFNGYYVLGNDIDASGYTHTSAIANISSASANLPDTKLRGLTGTFDGLGHTISGLNLNKCSLFGTIYEGTVKNVAFTNVTMTGANTAAIAWYTYKGAIENVFVSIKSLPESWNRAAFAGKISTTTVVKNVIVELTNVPVNVYGGYGSYAFSYAALNAESKNIYVVSETPLTVGSKTYDAENTGAENVYVGIKRYNDYGEFAESKNDYTSFANSKVWNTEGDYPVFNGQRAKKTVKETIDYSTVDGFTSADTLAIFGEENVTIASATENTAGYTVSVNENKLAFTYKGAEFIGDGTVHNVVLSTDTVDYSVNLKIVTKILRVKEDLAVFTINDKTGEFKGYYLLAKDIDATGYTHATGVNATLSNESGRWFMTAGYGNAGLKGTFDGNGHSINNLTVGKYGIFGLINGGTVKNVAFKDLKYTNQSNIVTLAWYIVSASIENVYMNAESLPNVWARAMMASSIYNSKMNNVIIKLGDVLGSTGVKLNVYGDLGAYGSFVSSNANYLFDGDKANAFTNVYVISTTKLSVLSKSQFDGENKDPENCYNGIKRYDTENEMTEAANDYTSFTESGMWSVTGNNVPTFKA
ncbi:MAG: hypothetical protein SPJ19_00540 [Candidatus Borkfalkiaceae bacterium]|nr:hypothetical protein [Christensenellaceae bacterium]